MLRKMALRRNGWLGACLAGLIMLGLAGCGTAAVPTEPTPTPTSVAAPPSPTAELPALTEELPTATTAAPVPTDSPQAVENTPTTGPMRTAAPSPSVAASTPGPTTAASDYTWTQVGLKGKSLTGMDAFAQGSDSLVLVGSPDGIWRSTYDYMNWEKLNVPLPGEGRTVSVVVASTDVMYATRHTGCASGMSMSRARSTDGGGTWAPMSGEMLTIAAADANTAYGTTCSGIVKTTDSGATWTEVGASRVNYDPNSVATSPDGQTVYYSATSEGGTGYVAMSKNGGATWTDVTPKNGPNGEFTAPGNLTFVAALEGRPQDGGLYLTSMQGLWFLSFESAQWKLLAGPSVPGQPADAVSWYGALFVDTAYSADFYKPGPVIYTGRGQTGADGQAEGLGIFRSLDLGKTWESFGKGLEKRTVEGIDLVAVDRGDDGRHETLLAATSDGVWAIKMQPAQ